MIMIAQLDSMEHTLPAVVDANIETTPNKLEELLRKYRRCLIKIIILSKMEK